jgi:ABC-type transporter Mla maintaining outer membrane lipid asymmetry ATPase subunit MlaF
VRRVAVARALASEPRVIIADECVAGLARWLGSSTRLPVALARHGETVQAGVAVDQEIVVRRR